MKIQPNDVRYAIVRVHDGKVIRKGYRSYNEASFHLNAGQAIIGYTRKDRELDGGGIGGLFYKASFS